MGYNFCIGFRSQLVPCRNYFIAKDLKILYYTVMDDGYFIRSMWMCINFVGYAVGRSPCVSNPNRPW